MKEIRWGIIGVGDVCEVKSAPAMNLIPGSRIEAVMRRDGLKAKSYAERHGVSKWYDQADDLIHDPRVNAIYIATPPSSHADYTIRAAAARKPVYVEKPMATTYKDCLKMIDACTRAEVPLLVAYYRRALPNMIKVKDLLEEGAIGEVRSVQVLLNQQAKPEVVSAGRGANWRVDPAVAGGGYFYDLASHQLDALDFLFGPISQASGYALNQNGAYSAEDMVVGSFAFESGIAGSGSWCFAAAEAEERTTITGSQGSITFPFFGDHAVVLRQPGKPEQRFEFQMPAHIQQPLIEQVVAELQGGSLCVSRGESAARTNLIMEKMCRRDLVQASRLP